jgi:hypothetical protein
MHPCTSDRGITKTVSYQMRIDEYYSPTYVLEKYWKRHPVGKIYKRKP